MSKPGPSRRMLALIAAYAIALQALLLPLSLAAAGPFAGALCAAAAGQVTPGQTTPDNPSDPAGCGCAAGCGVHCCSQTSAAAPQAAAGLLPPTVGSPMAPPAPRQAVITARRLGPLARGPPRV